MKRVKNYLVVFSILTGAFFSFNNIEVLAEEQERDVFKESQIIENLKEKHPSWSIVLLNTNKSNVTHQSISYNSPWNMMETSINTPHE